MPEGVDHAAAWRGLRRELRAPGPDGQPRSSWGRPQLLELLDRLEVENEIDETSDRATLRRFAGHLTDTFLNLVPAGITDPLPDDDRETSPRMDGPTGPPDDRGGHDGHAPDRADHARA